MTSLPSPGLCLYCDSELDGSREHLLLSAIGGRKESRIKGGTLSTGQRCNLLPGGGVPQPLDVTLKVEEANGIKRTTIRAPANKKHVIRQILEGLVAKEGKTLDDLTNATARLESTYPEEYLTYDSEIRGTDSLRAVAKMALTLLAVEIGSHRVRTQDFARIRAFITHGDIANEELVNFDYQNEFPHLPSLSTFAGWSHRIAISANQETGVVVAFASLYGAIPFSAILSSDWNSSSLTYAYIVDPVTGQQEEPRGFSPSSATLRQLLEHRLDKQAFQSALEKLEPLVRQRMNQTTIHRIVKDAIEEAFADLPARQPESNRPGPLPPLRASEIQRPGSDTGLAVPRKYEEGGPIPALLYLEVRTPGYGTPGLVLWNMRGPA